MLPEADEDGVHEADTLGLEDWLGDTLTEVDVDVVTLGLDEEHTSVWTVSRNGGTPPDVIDPMTVCPVPGNVVVSTVGSPAYDGLSSTSWATEVPSTAMSISVPTG